MSALAESLEQARRAYVAQIGTPFESMARARYEHAVSFVRRCEAQLRAAGRKAP